MLVLDVRPGVIYSSAAGSVHRLADAFAQGAAEAGAEVRVRRVPEVAARLALQPTH